MMRALTVVLTIVVMLMLINASTSAAALVLFLKGVDPGTMTAGHEGHSSSDMTAIDLTIIRVSLTAFLCISVAFGVGFAVSFLRKFKKPGFILCTVYSTCLLLLLGAGAILAESTPSYSSTFLSHFSLQYYYGIIASAIAAGVFYVQGRMGKRMRPGYDQTPRQPQ